MPTIAIYARKSTESEDRQILSIESQVRELNEFAKREGILVSTVFTESKSAKAPGRPVFNDLCSRVQKGEFDGVICWKLDRLARNPVDGGALIWSIEEQKLKAIYTPQRSFQNTGNDKFWMQLEFGMAKKYVDDLSDNVKRGIRARLAQGWSSNLPPLGYLNDRNKKTIVRDPDRFPLVRRMWDLMLTGNQTPFSILKTATGHWGLRTRQFSKSGGNPLSLSVIYKLFRNPFYYGMVVCKGVFYQGAHEPMITTSEFDKVQRLLSKTCSPRPHRHSFPYTGIIKCGECGASVTAERRKNRYGYIYIYYHCTHNKPGIRCYQKVISVGELERQVSGFLETITISKRAKEWAIARAIAMNEVEADQDKAEVASLNRRLASCKRELVTLVNMRIKELIGDDDFLAKKHELENERAHIQELLQDADGRFGGVLERITSFFEFVSSARQLFENGTDEQKKTILSQVGSNLVLKDKILSIQAPNPFFFVQNTLRSAAAKKLMFEPRLFGESKGQNSRKGSGISRWWALVQDVRTFFLKNPRFPSYQIAPSESRSRS